MNLFKYYNPFNWFNLAAALMIIPVYIAVPDLSGWRLWLLLGAFGTLNTIGYVEGRYTEWRKHQ